MAGNIEMYLRQPLCADAGLVQVELVVAHRTLQGTAPLEMEINHAVVGVLPVAHGPIAATIVFNHSNTKKPLGISL